MGVVEKAINTYGRIMSLLAILGALAVRGVAAFCHLFVQWPQAGSHECRPHHCISLSIPPCTASHHCLHLWQTVSRAGTTVPDVLSDALQPYNLQ